MAEKVNKHQKNSIINPPRNLENRQLNRDSTNEYLKSLLTKEGNIDVRTRKHEKNYPSRASRNEKYGHFNLKLNG